MKNKRVNLNYRGKIFSLNLKVCNRFERFSGLMFQKREKAKAHLFEFNRSTNMSIHSFFVFFPFIVIWTDSDDKIVDLKLIKPFEPAISPKKSFTKLIEIPLSKKYSDIVKILVEHRKI